MGESILIRVRGLADFLVQPETASIDCHACPQAHPSSVRHFLLNQVLPRLISVRDPLVIHASAVASQCGAIALIGPSGVGKSTLAASLALHRRLELISDDGILVRVAGQSNYLIGASNHSRLRPDSFAALGLDQPSHHAGLPTGGKQVLKVACDHQASAAPVAAIRALFFLGEAQRDQGTVKIRHLIGTTAVMALIKNSFLLDSGDHGLLQRQFDGAAALIRNGCPCYALTYPRRFADLAQVQARILAALTD